MILVTGGTGLVGIHLLMELSKLPNQKIVAIYRSQDSLSHASLVFHKYNAYEDESSNWSKIIWIEADITIIASLNAVFENYNITQVYHCAGYVTFLSAAFDKLKKVNIEGTANIVNLSIDFGIQKLCYVSSISTLNPSPGQSVLDESSQWNAERQNSGYAISKYGGEMEIWRGSEEGLSVIIVHPGVVIGKGYRTGSSDIFCKVKKGLPFYTEGITGYVTVTDVVKAMAKLMDSAIVNERFVLVSENLSHKKVITTIANSLGKKAPKRKVSKIVIDIFAKLEAGLSFVFGYVPIIPMDIKDSLFSESIYSSQKIEKAIPFSFQSMKMYIKEVSKTFKD